MKKLLLVIAVLLFLAIVGVGIFLATFDADRYRPLLISRLEQTLGKPVTLAHISLGWDQGIALQLNGLTIAQQADPQGEPLIQIESIGALVRLMPLLHKDVEISSVVLKRPRIHAARDANGQMDLLGLAAAGSPAAASGKTGVVGGTSVSFNVDSLRIQDGTLHWTDAMTRPHTDLWIKALAVTVRHISPGKALDVDITGALAGDAPDFHMSGRVTLPGPSHRGSIEAAQLSMEHVPLDRFLPPALPGMPALRGIMTMSAEGGASTLDASELARHITGHGALKLAEPMIVNLNVLRTVFEKMSMIPGLVERLQSRLPPEYQAKLEAQHTILHPVDLSMAMDEGVMRFNELDLRTDTFGISGNGSVGLDGTVSVRSPLLRIEPTFSAALIKSVRELEALTNAKGELEIPLIVRGQTPQLSVLPDLNYVTSKVVVTKVQDVLSALIQKSLEKEQPADGQTRPPQTGSSPRSLLGQLLQKALEPDNPSTASPQP